MINTKYNSIGQLYTYLFDASRTVNQLRLAKKNNLITIHFIERIMLAVTEVNGCDICSYGHTKIALEQGMTKEEITMLLAGETDSVPEEELHAVMFAQHYADTKGKPSEAAWVKLVQEYGTDAAYGILGATRVIMFGNTFGISLGNIKNQFTNKKNDYASLMSDLINVLSIFILLPTAIIHTLINRKILNNPLIEFDSLAQLE